jgi:hypothetical protein
MKDYQPPYSFSRKVDRNAKSENCFSRIIFLSLHYKGSHVDAYCFYVNIKAVPILYRCKKSLKLWVCKNIVKQ